jgi:hypothetical protein
LHRRLRPSRLRNGRQLDANSQQILIDIAPHQRFIAADTRTGRGSISAPLNNWMQGRDVPYPGNVRVGRDVKPTCRSLFFHLRVSRGSSLLDKGTQGCFVDQVPSHM